MNSLVEKELYIIEPVVVNMGQKFHFDNPVVPFHFVEEIIIPPSPSQSPNPHPSVLLSPPPPPTISPAMSLSAPAALFKESIKIVNPQNSTINIDPRAGKFLAGNQKWREFFPYISHFLFLLF